MGLSRAILEPGWTAPRALITGGFYWGILELQADMVAMCDLGLPDPELQSVPLDLRGTERAANL